MHLEGEGEPPTKKLKSRSGARPARANGGEEATSSGSNGGDEETLSETGGGEKEKQSGNKEETEEPVKPPKQQPRIQSAIYAAHKISSSFNNTHTINLTLVGMWPSFR